MKTQEVWEQFAAFENYNLARNLSPKSLALYDRVLNLFRNWFDETHGPDAELTSSHIREWMAYKFQRGNTARTVKNYWRILQTFFNFLLLEEVITEDENPMRRVKSPRVLQSKIEALTPDQIRAFLDSFDKSRVAQYRDYVACILALDSGLRANELLGLTLPDLDMEHQSLRVNGKGRKIRTVYFGEKVRALLSDYLERCRPWLRNGTNTLFPPQGSGPCKNRLGVTQFSYSIRRRFREVGIQDARSSAHRLRHTFAVQYIRNGGNPFVLQELLGHTTLTMTRRYVSLAQADLAKDHKKASPINSLEI